MDQIADHIRRIGIKQQPQQTKNDKEKSIELLVEKMDTQGYNKRHNARP
jgi:hypothetical protein